MNNEIIYRIENEDLILDYYFNDKKIGSTNAGCIINILNQVKLYNDEYNTLVEQNKYMIDIAKSYEKLQQENQQLKIQISAREELCNRLENNWNKLKEYIDIKLYNVEYLQKLCGCGIDDKIHMILDIIKKEMQELEQGGESG